MKIFVFGEVCEIKEKVCFCFLKLKTYLQASIHFTQSQLSQRTRDSRRHYDLLESTFMISNEPTCHPVSRPMIIDAFHTCHPELVSGSMVNDAILKQVQDDKIVVHDNGSLSQDDKVAVHLYGTFVFLGLLFFASSLFAEVEEGQTKMKFAKSLPGLSIQEGDINAKIGAIVSTEYYDFSNAQTFRKDFNDHCSFFFNRACLCLDAQKKCKDFNKSVVEMFTRIACTNYWQIEYAYFPISDKSLRIEGLNNLDTATHSHRAVVPHVILENAYLKINIDTILKDTHKLPSYLQAGLFDYQLGRGIALGFYNDGAVYTLGWDYIGSSFMRSVRQSPPGVLLGVVFNKNLSAELYFSKWTSYSASIDGTNEDILSTRVFGSRPYRGINKDRNSYALKVNYDKQKTKIGDVHVEPYFVYTRAPDQKIEVLSDASTDISTAGLMVETKNKNWVVNVELDGQLGHQNVYAIDRNQISLAQDDSGKAYEIYTHVYQDKAKTQSARVSDALMAVVNLPENRNPDMNGKELKGASGYWNAGDVVDVPTANRIRNGYKLNLSSIAAFADASYEFFKMPLKLAGAVAYVGGDSFPYNKEDDRNFKNFVTLRDSQYWGRMVRSYALMNLGYIPRPQNIDMSKMYNVPQIPDRSNLRYFGFAGTFYPLKNRKKSEITLNALWFWEIGELKKWDKNADLSLLDSTTRTYIQNAQSAYGFSGWLSDKSASKMLGSEYNILFSISPLDALLLYGSLYSFIPGKLLKDIEGQPNVMTIRASADLNKQHKMVYDSLGHATSYGCSVGAKYEF